MMQRFFLIFLLFIAMTFIFAPNALYAQPETIYVFANMNVQDSVLSQADIQSIYLGKKDKWTNNQGINFTALGNGTCHDAFIRKFVGRTPFQFQNYWKKQIFTGKGQPPRAFDSDAEVVDYVSRTSGAIGFSCTPPDSSKVKVLTIN